MNEEKKWKNEDARGGLLSFRAAPNMPSSTGKKSIGGVSGVCERRLIKVSLGLGGEG